MSKEGVFSSEELEHAFACVEPGLADYQAHLDRISDDIKKLEQKLEARNFNIEVWILGGYFNGFTSDGPNYVDHKLGWAPTDGGRFRLMYRAPPGLGIEKRERPLIETPVEIRLEMHKHLPELLAEVGKALRSDLVEVDPDPAELDA
jgi:hypothetical protein